MMAAQERELVGVGQGPLQPDGGAPTVLGERVQREESPLYPGHGGLAPERMRDVVMGQDDRGKLSRREGAEDKGELWGRVKTMASEACQV